MTQILGQPCGFQVLSMRTLDEPRRTPTMNVLALRDDGNELKLVQSVDMPSGTPARAPPGRGRHYMIQPLVELYGECMVVFKVS